MCVCSIWSTRKLAIRRHSPLCVGEPGRESVQFALVGAQRVRRGAALVGQHVQVSIDQRVDERTPDRAAIEPVAVMSTSSASELFARQGAGRPDSRRASRFGFSEPPRAARMVLAMHGLQTAERQMRVDLRG